MYTTLKSKLKHAHLFESLLLSESLESLDDASEAVDLRCNNLGLFLAFVFAFSRWEDATFTLGVAASPSACMHTA